MDIEALLGSDGPALDAALARAREIARSLGAGGWGDLEELLAEPLPERIVLQAPTPAANEDTVAAPAEAEVVAPFAAVAPPPVLVADAPPAPAPPPVVAAVAPAPLPPPEEPDDKTIDHELEIDLEALEKGLHEVEIDLMPATPAPAPAVLSQPPAPRRMPPPPPPGRHHATPPPPPAAAFATGPRAAFTPPPLLPVPVVLAVDPEAPTLDVPVDFAAMEAADARTPPPEAIRAEAKSDKKGFFSKLFKK